MTVFVNFCDHIPFADLSFKDASTCLAADEVVITQCRCLHEEWEIEFSWRMRDFFDDELEQGAHIHSWVFDIQCGKTAQPGSIADGEVELFIICTEFDE